ncbi:NACHT, LRR and PYD domains-containing protein 6 [Dromaius novaehollandiae]|uniref:NACHT, LRR and PYD domains-containing protein 6 n=1 Tax=Dromaius novaehollandiae TaxID=8790 RepID=UPI0031202A9A
MASTLLPQAQVPSPGEQLLQALEELSQADFKSFRDKLAHGDLPGQCHIPWGKLEHADRIDTKNLMVSYYGKDAALDVAVTALEQIHLHSVVARLREGRGKALGPAPLPRSSAPDYREDYKTEIRNAYSRIKDRNALIGGSVSLNERYSELVIVNKHRDEEQCEHEIKATGRRHVEIMKEQANSSVALRDLFEPGPDGWVPKVVVLLGAAGIGKTMAARKIMLDWASGKVFKKFDYVFYIHCREGNLLTREVSVADLVSRCCPGASPQQVNEILKSPEKLLFVIDGFDELRFSFDLPPDELCSQPSEKRPTEITLSSLFRKMVLHKSSLLITTRPAALQKLSNCLECERYAEILGFSVAERKKYFRNFFKNTKQEAADFPFVQGNEIVFTMCLVPIMCWIICTVMKQQLSKKQALARNVKTTTGIYTLYLSALLDSLSSKSKQGMPVVLWKLSCLAAEGVWKQKVLFEEEEVQKYALDQREVLPLLLNERVFQQDIDCVSTYSFIHLSFQEFFAALFYLREDEGETETLPADLTRDVNKLLENYSNSRNYFTLTVRFLFGLSNEEQRKALEKKTGCKISPKITQELLVWLLKSQETKLAVLTEETTVIQELEVCHCLYEIQDERFVTTALDQFTGMHLQGVNLNQFDQIVLSFSMKNFTRLESLHLGHCSFIWDNPEDDTGQQPAKENQQEEGKDSPIHSLCQALENSGCKLKRLRFDRCQLTGACCGALASVLRAKSTLTVLDLGGNEELRDAGVKLLCEGLNHAACQVQTLRLGCCNLTAASCKHLAVVLGATPSLADLDLSDNPLTDDGVQELCRGLAQPSCGVQKLWYGAPGSRGMMGATRPGADLGIVIPWRARLSAPRRVLPTFAAPRSQRELRGHKALWRCCLTEVGCGALATALRANPSVTELHLGNNELGDGGVRRLCESLRDGACRVQELRLWQCCLTEASCEALASVLRTNRSLTELHLGDNELGDGGMRRLCEGLRDSACRVRILSLWQCQLTEGCCADLAAVLSASQSLENLDLSENNLGDSSARLLYEGLRHPACLLKTLWLDQSGLSEETLQNLAALMEIKPHLNIGYT